MLGQCLLVALLLAMVFGDLPEIEQRAVRVQQTVNLLFLLACFTVLWGTWFPKISEWVQNSKVTVGPPFYNNVAVPVALLLLLLTAVGPLLGTRDGARLRPMK